MLLGHRLRRWTLTTHLAFSVGWLGAVGVFLALSIVGATSDDPALVAGVYPALQAVGWLVLVPLAVASLATGVVQALGTEWGFLLHCWVVFGLRINLVSIAVLLA